jgi:hypothetical protein
VDQTQLEVLRKTEASERDILMKLAGKTKRPK